MKIKSLKIAAMLLLVLLLFTQEKILQASESCTLVEDIRHAISITLKPVFYGRLIARDKEKQLELAKIIVEVSNKYSLDPYLYTSMGYHESSFRTYVIGKKGEEGIWQVHGMAAKGCNLNTLRGQADCGAKWFRNRIDFCGSVEAGLTAYVSRSCRTEKGSPVHKAVQRRLKFARKLKEKVSELKSEANKKISSL